MIVSKFHRWDAFLGEVIISNGNISYILKVGYNDPGSYSKITDKLYIRLYGTDNSFLCGCWVETLPIFKNPSITISAKLMSIIIDTSKRIEKLKAFI